MRGKIFRSTFLVAAVVFLSCIVLFMAALYGYFDEVQHKQLRSELTFAAKAVDEEGVDYLKNFDINDDRLTLVAPDGSVIYDTWTDADKLENHGKREEIADAFEKGTGESSRYSATFMEETLYYAKELSSGDVLRISTSRMTIPSLILGMLQPICVIIFIALILSIILSARIAKQIARPLNDLDLDRPLENEVYDEIAPMLTKIEQGRREIAQRKDELKKKEEEFDAVTQSMDEGLVLLNGEQEVLTINPAARKFYGTDSRCIGDKFFTLDRDTETNEMIEAALKNGAAERIKERCGREYQMHASSIRSEDQAIGIALLIFDITERAFAERNRREFAANVSHELKSPLHSIMGSAELIKDGLIKQEDLSKFGGLIYKEAARLVTLIDDIIRLSKLDEKTNLPTEEIKLKTLVEEEIKLLKPAADEKKVTLVTTGDEVTCSSSRQLLHEVVYNLCDNAIKYNKVGGSVTVMISERDGIVRLSVEDTGIGIPEEHQARIFERFYRVDKSHSRESGGTGLGLSIVKHAVRYIGGEISLESREGEGTKITVTFPADLEA